jgi:hypothetical protein
MEGVCDVKEPPDIDLGNGRYVRCHLYSEEQVQS